jgi:hypothetical protein
MSLERGGIIIFFALRNRKTERIQPNREVSEWLKEHAWKVCIPQKGIEGSNPFLSAYKANFRNEVGFFIYGNFKNRGRKG